MEIHYGAQCDIAVNVICLLLHCPYWGNELQQFHFKHISSHVKVQYFVMAVSYILQYHNKEIKKW